MSEEWVPNPEAKYLALLGDLGIEVGTDYRRGQISVLMGLLQEAQAFCAVPEVGIATAMEEIASVLETFVDSHAMGDHARQMFSALAASQRLEFEPIDPAPTDYHVAQPAPEHEPPAQPGSNSSRLDAPQPSEPAS